MRGSNIPIRALSDSHSLRHTERKERQVVGSPDQDRTVELLATIAAELQRLKPTVPFQRECESPIVVGPVCIDIESHEASIDGVPVQLRPREFALLRLLAQNAGRALSREQLLDLAWPDAGRISNTRTVDVHIYRLRIKIEPVGHLIRTVGGVGYKLARIEHSNRGG